MNVVISQLIIQNCFLSYNVWQFFHRKKNALLTKSQKGPVVFTSSAQVFAQLFMLLNTKQGIL